MTRHTVSKKEKYKRISEAAWEKYRSTELAALAELQRTAYKPERVEVK